MRPVSRRTLGPPLAAALGLLAAGCGPGVQAAVGHSAVPGGPGASPVPAAAAQPHPRGRPAPAVAPLTSRLPADVVVSSTHPLSAATLHRLERLPLAAGSTPLARGAVRVDGHAVHAVGVDPSQFRRFAPKGTAESTPVWQAIAGGDAVVSHATARRLHLTLGSSLTVTHGGATETLRLAALATTLPDADLVVGTKQARALQLPGGTGLVLSAGGHDAGALAAAVRSVVGSAARIDLLRAPKGDPVAFLSGSAAARAFGAFSYRYFADGTIEPDAEWVADNIRTEQVPILGSVTCHRLMFRQLRGALSDVVAAGLAGAIKPGEYGGCYVPRFIESSPGHAISLHTWGIAIDLNVAENQRGTAGRMNRQVVTIFKRWGFRWGGDWSYTDPMHFELGALLSD